MTEYSVKTERGTLKIPFDAEQVKFEGSHFSKRCDSTTLYFILPKEWANELYPEACAAELAMEFSCTYLDPSLIRAEMAYTVEEDGTFVDCGWWDMELLPQDVEKLIELGNKTADSQAVIKDCVEQIDDIISALTGIITQPNLSGKAVSDCNYANKCLLESRRTLLALKGEI